MFDQLLQGSVSLVVNPEYHSVRLLKNSREVCITGTSCFVSNGLPLSTTLNALVAKCKYHNDERDESFTSLRNKSLTVFYLNHSDTCEHCEVYEKIKSGSPIVQSDLPKEITLIKEH